MTIRKALTTEWWDENVQRGSISIVGTRYADVTFSSTFALVPVVLLTMRDPTNKVLVLTAVSTVGFSVDMGNITTVNIDWIAIAR